MRSYMWRSVARGMVGVLVLGIVLASTSCTSDEGGDAPSPGGSTPAPEPPSPPASTPPAGEYRPLFDGTQESLDQWRMAGPGGFVVQDDGSVLTTGGMGLLWYPERFASYRLRLDWKVAGDDNSGVFVGFPEPGDDPGVAVEQGYEIQIDATDEPDRTTGAIYAVQGADTDARDAVLNPPGVWNTYEIVVDGQGIDVYLNDELINRFEGVAPERDLSEGFIGLQNHGEDDQVYFRDVRVAQR